MIGERQQSATPGVPLLPLFLAATVVSMLGILRGAKLRDMLGVLARQYLKKRARSKT